LFTPSWKRPDDDCPSHCEKKELLSVSGIDISHISQKLIYFLLQNISSKISKQTIFLLLIDLYYLLTFNPETKIALSDFVFKNNMQLHSKSKYSRFDEFSNQMLE
jgi:hypothetical protein